MPQVDHLTPVILNEISHRNEISEHRFFITKFHSDAEYLGFATWRWHQKCKHLISLNQLAGLEMKPNVVWYAWEAKDWYTESKIRHRGIEKYLDMLVSHTGLQHGKRSFYANQFICHRDIFFDFMEKFKEWFNHFDKQNLNYNYTVQPKDKPRTPACFYERFSTLYFANRTDLIFKQIPEHGKYQ